MNVAIYDRKLLTTIKLYIESFDTFIYIKKIMHIISYDGFSKFLHWLMAIVIIYATVAGYIMHLVVEQKPIFSFLSVMNISLATVAAPLLVIRFIWKYFRNEPELTDQIPKFQKKIAHLFHSLIYLAMFIVFTSGFLMLKEEFVFFWVLTLNNPITDPSINAFFFTVQRYGCISLMLLVIVHVSAALNHHFIKKNNVLRMMLPNSSSNKRKKKEVDEK